MSGRQPDLTWDFVRGNRASSITIAVMVAIASFLLALLGCVLYNFWADGAAQAAAEGANWQERLTGELLVTAMVYLAVMVLAATALVLIISSAFAVSMESRVRQLGLLATVGATPRQIRSLLLRESLLLSLGPAAVGIALGVLGANGFIAFAINLARQLEISLAAPLEFRLHPLLLLAVALLVLLTVAVASGRPARKLAKTAPLAAVAAMPDEQFAGQGRQGLASRIFGVEGELAEASLRQRRRLLRPATVALTLSFIVFGLFLSFMTVSRLSVEQTYYERYGVAWDAVVDGTADGEGALQAIAQDLEDDAEAMRMEGFDGGLRLYVKAREGSEDAVRADLEKTAASLDPAAFRLVDMEADRRRSQAIWDGYQAVVGGFCGILALIGVSGVFAQAVGFVTQRRREFARLRSLGLDPKGLAKMLAVEGLETVGRPLAVALPFIIGAALVLALLGRQPLTALLAGFPYGAIAAYIIAVTLVVLAAYSWGGHRILRCNLFDIL